MFSHVYLSSVCSVCLRPTSCYNSLNNCVSPLCQVFIIAVLFSSQMIQSPSLPIATNIAKYSETGHITQAILTYTPCRSADMWLAKKKSHTTWYWTQAERAHQPVANALLSRSCIPLSRANPIMAFMASDYFEEPETSNISDSLSFSSFRIVGLTPEFQQVHAHLNDWSYVQKHNNQFTRAFNSNVLKNPNPNFVTCS